MTPQTDPHSEEESQQGKSGAPSQTKRPAETTESDDTGRQCIEWVVGDDDLSTGKASKMVKIRAITLLFAPLTLLIPMYLLGGGWDRLAGVCASVWLLTAGFFIGDKLDVVYKHETVDAAFDMRRFD